MTDIVFLSDLFNSEWIGVDPADLLCVLNTEEVNGLILAQQANDLVKLSGEDYDEILEMLMNEEKEHNTVLNTLLSSGLLSLVSINNEYHYALIGEVDEDFIENNIVEMFLPKNMLVFLDAEAFVSYVNGTSITVTEE